jgi:hypothetical protein
MRTLFKRGGTPLKVGEGRVFESSQRDYDVMC